MLTTSWVEQAPVIGATQNEPNGNFTDFLSYFALFRHFLVLSVFCLPILLFVFVGVWWLFKGVFIAFLFCFCLILKGERKRT